ncbi:MAG TPA: SEC-C metal-binding domain-containing protein, partial [Polyangiaceae bacterium]|nr:SEC-C metal-binding domain-containing protein [Polyangiaceae bacterium]
RKNLLAYDDVMTAQRRTVYTLRQQLLLGTYSPEDVDDAGKPTGEPRKIAMQPDIAAQVADSIAMVVGYFCDPQLQAFNADRKPRAPTRDELQAATKIVELEVLQHEVYEAWGVKLDLSGRKERAPIEVYEELSKAVPQSLSEQRERVLDLLDRVVSAMVEESCPDNRPPENWDWKGMYQGFEEHFKVRPDSTVEELGDADLLVKRLYETAEQLYIIKEKELGVETALRVFRHMYVEAMDEAWVDHLSNMEHLRDGIGLRGYGQRDPKNEYKKEAYNLFLTMMAKVSSNVLVRLFEAQPRRREELAAAEAEAARRHHEELEHTVARHPSAGGEDPAELLEQLRQAVETASAPPRAAAPKRKEGPKIGRNDVCPCGSGKKFKKCHGAILEDDASASDDDDDDEQQPRA